MNLLTIFLWWLQVAQKFYTLLVLKKNQALEVSQSHSFAEIMVSQGAKFDSPALWI